MRLSHTDDSLLPRLQAYGLDVGAVIEQGRYIALDADARPDVHAQWHARSGSIYEGLGDQR